MSGRDRSAENQQKTIAATQTKAMTDQIAASDARMKKADELAAPATSFASGIASGDINKMISAASVPLGNLVKSQKAAEANIFDSVPEGPVRDFMIASSKRDAPAQQSQFLNNTFFQSLGALTDAGKTESGLGLQQLAAGSRFGEAGANTNSTLINAATQRKAATMGAIGQAAGMAGSIYAGGGFKNPFKSAGGGGGAAVASSGLGSGSSPFTPGGQ